MTARSPRLANSLGLAVEANDLVSAARSQCQAIVELLLASGANINVRSRSGESAVQAATRPNFTTDMADLLRARGAPE